MKNKHESESGGGVGSSKLFGALAALTGLCREPVGSWVKTNPTLLYTKNLFGPQEEISGKILRLVERNIQGDCCCVFDGKTGTNLVDVDYRDIAPNDRTERRDGPPLTNDNNQNVNGPSRSLQ